MKLITIDIELASVLLVKRGVYYIALLSYVNDDEFNKMSLFYVRRFAVEKETYPSTI